jgi:enterochelin esterase-like enzyme
MTRYLLLSICILIGLPLQSQTFADFIDYLDNLPMPERQMAVDSFVDNTVFPHIEGNTEAHFIYQGPASAVFVAGDFNGWSGDADALTHVSETNLWYRTETFPSNARLDYKIVADGSWILDPLHDNTISGGFGPNSEWAMPDYVQPWEIEENPDIAQGTIETINFESDVLNQTYQVKIYLPPSYNEVTDRTYPSVYVHDGTEYLTLGSADQILDNLIDAGTISELIGVFIRPNDRNQEYAGTQRIQYQQFVAQELVSYIDANYRTIADREQRATLGTSFGGNISGLLTHNHHEVFGKCGLHSPAFWPNNFQTSNLLTDGLAQDARFAAVWGTYEPGIDVNATQVMDVLSGEGQEIYDNKYPEGHSWGLWRATLDELLVFLFPPGLTSVRPVPQDERGFRVYPNPCQQPCDLHLELEEEWAGNWTLFNVAGQSISTGQAGPGNNHIPIPPSVESGIYWLSFGEGGVALPLVIE